MNISDVRDFIGKAIKEVANSDATPEEMSAVLERAKQTSALASAYVQVVKCELDGAKLYAEHGVIPASIDAPVVQRATLKAIG